MGWGGGGFYFSFIMFKKKETNLKNGTQVFLSLLFCVLLGGVGSFFLNIVYKKKRKPI